MVHFLSPLAISVAMLASLGLGHPGHDVKQEAAERAAFLKRAPAQSRSLAQCASTLKARGVEEGNVARRAKALQNLRRERGLTSEYCAITAILDLTQILSSIHCTAN